jgi:hypothetical protein
LAATLTPAEGAAIDAANIVICATFVVDYSARLYLSPGR